MGTTLNDTPSANRLHIGVFGKTNSGKSSLINAFTGQEVSIASNVAGTTTDPVYKAMEIHPLGACTIIDTAGFDDESELGAKRVEKTRLAAEKTDIAVMVFSAEVDSSVSDMTANREADKSELNNMELLKKYFAQELKWYQFFKEKNTPVLLIINKADIGDAKVLQEFLTTETNEQPLIVSAVKREGIDQIKEALARKVPENFGNRLITGNLVGEDDFVILVMPQDIQAPKGRLILPQVQTLRELLDKKCLVMSVTTDQYVEALSHLTEAPKLIITDSQVFAYVYEHKPENSMLTSFSVLFAAYKGDIEYYIEGANAIGKLNGESHVLIAECCTHAPLKEDIGREKIPKMLRKRYGETMKIDIVSGTDFPDDLTGYDLIIQCGGCMFNRKYIMSRIDHAKEQQKPMTNYGVTIAYLTGILDKVVVPRF